MKRTKIDWTQVTLAMLVIAFMVLCIGVVRQTKGNVRPIYEPPCSAPDLTIIEELHCAEKIRV